MQDLKEEIEKAKQRVEEADSKKWELVSKLNKLEEQLSNVFKTADLIAFLDGMVKNKAVIRKSYEDDYMIVSGFNFGSTAVYLTGEFLSVSKNQINHYINGSEKFSLNEDTIEEILKSTLNIEDQKDIKNTLSKWKEFYYRMNKEEEN